MHCVIELNQQALCDNFQVFKQLAASSIVAPVLKSNAYGHGLAPIYQSLKAQSPRCICVAYLSEAQELRQLGYKERILIVTPVFPDEWAQAYALNADILLLDHNFLKAWLAAHPRPKAHLKFDTGLSRQGFLYDQTESIINILKSTQGSHDLVGVCSHFANVEDVLDHDYARLQLKRFQAICDQLSHAGFHLIRHIASSASTLLLKESHFDLVRVGISLYGCWPSQATRLSYLNLNKQMIELKPVLSWRSKLSQIRHIKAGSYIGYGCSYRAAQDMTLGIVPVGYYEGYTRASAQQGAYVLVNGQRCPIIGRISMNLITIDVSHLSCHLKTGQMVTLLGQDGQEQISADQLADWSHTINYEVLARLSPFMPRITI